MLSRSLIAVCLLAFALTVFVSAEEQAFQSKNTMAVEESDDPDHPDHPTDGGAEEAHDDSHDDSHEDNHDDDESHSDTHTDDDSNHEDEHHDDQEDAHPDDPADHSTDEGHHDVEDVHVDDDDEHHEDEHHEDDDEDHEDDDDDDDKDGLSFRETKNRLKILLEKIDTNNDQQVTIDEMKDWVTKTHGILPKQAAAEGFNKSDTNNDSHVSWEEHLMEVYKIKDDLNLEETVQGSTDDKKRQISRIQEDKDLFAASDKNNDGLLDKTEYNTFSTPEDNEALIPMLLHHAVGGRDKDGDGKLSYEEYSSPSTTYHAEDEADHSREDFDKHVDKNGDGFLDKEEMKKHYLPNSLNGALDEVEHIIDEADSNKDKVLSFDEAMKFIDVIIDSPVTDYGHHIENIHTIKDEL